MKSPLRWFAVPALMLSLGSASSAFGAATVSILNNDAAGVGFNDPTAVAPVGGNAGTTLGQQRLIAFQAAAATWGATLDSTVTVTVRAQWTALTCTATSAVLGSAGAVTIHRDFANAPFTGTWYGGAIANKLATSDLDPSNPEINANFNVNLGLNANCLPGSPFYLGLDGNHGTGIDLVTVLTHEFGHGLGFQTFTAGTTGAFNSGFPSVYDRFLMDGTSGKSWLQMTNAERAASAINARKLVWDGPRVLIDVPSVLSLGTPVLRVTSPPAIASNYEVGAASFGPQLTASGITGAIVLALDPSDGAGPSPTDGCSPLTNAAAINGNIALIDRGTCGFTTKVLNAQSAGAIAVIVADNAAGSPPAGLGGSDPAVLIPAVRITLGDGSAIKAQLGSGVNAVLQLDTSIRAGTDTFGKPYLFSPNPFQSGSSVSHWDTSAFPNQLMEPSINGDLTHQVTPPNDLTYSLMRDIGWTASSLPNTIIKTLGDNQTAPVNSPFALTATVTTSPAVSGLAVTWTAPTDLAGAGGATFAGTGTSSAITTTNVAGVATSPAITASSRPGVYPLNATIPGAGTASFALTNTLPKGLDIDANNAYDAATDGVLVVRYLFGLTGSTLSSGALGIGANPSRTADPALANYIASVLPYLDVDGNGKVDALTDGLMILRTLLGLSGTAVTQSALGVGAKRTVPADISAYIQSIKP
ncbi:MAG: PA domain-containing protein [Casimicrobium sp.]